MKTLLHLWSAVVHAGVGDKNTSENRHIIITNGLAMIIALVMLLVFLTFLISIPGRGLNLSRTILIISSVSMGNVILLNEFKFHNLAKQLVCWLPPLYVLFATILDKMLQPDNITLKEFVYYRFFTMTGAVFPFLIYKLKEWKWILMGLIPSFVVTVFGEQIHRYFGVGMADFHFYEPEQRIYDVLIAIAYFSLTWFIINLRYVSDKFEEKSIIQRDELQANLEKLNDLNKKISHQNQEIIKQSEVLQRKNRELSEAHKLIEKQRIQLQKRNESLSQQIQETSISIDHANEQLALQNNELQQFSFTISHKLRSPLVTLKGLLNLVDKGNFDQKNLELFNYIENTLHKMEYLFLDLNEIISLRSDLYQQKEFINLDEELTDIKNLFYEDLIKLNIDFSIQTNGVSSIYTNKQKFNSILYNLISNAIKFRSETRKPVISVGIEESDKHFVITVEDNGMGIDLKKFGNKMFSLFQRFHPKIDGKGLGLYLVRTQAESLGGHVHIESQPDEFTRVVVFLKKETPVHV